MTNWNFSEDEARALGYYLGEIEFQSSTAKLGAHLMLDESEDSRRRFMWAQMFLGACAMVSKHLWPARKTRHSKDRAANLRQLLEVKDDSVLKSRDARNWLEHIDENFDDLLVPGVNTADFIIAPKSVFNVSDMNFLRCLDVTAGVLSVADLDVPYNDVLVETDRLGAVAAARKSEMDAISWGRTDVVR